MVKILAIDTSTDAYSVACYLTARHKNFADISEYFAIAPAEHSLFILPTIKNILAENNVSLANLDCLAFAAGPGSFTGVRLAASIIQGLALPNDLPVVAVSTLQCMAYGAYLEYNALRVLVAQDARMQEIYFGAYELNDENYMDSLLPDCLLGRQEAVAKIATFCQVEKAHHIIGVGSAWRIYPDIVSFLSPGDQLKIIDNYYPRARCVAMLAEHYWRAGKVGKAGEALPVYLRNEVAKAGAGINH